MALGSVLYPIASKPDRTGREMATGCPPAMAVEITLCALLYPPLYVEKRKLYPTNFDFAAFVICACVGLVE